MKRTSELVGLAAVLMLVGACSPGAESSSSSQSAMSTVSVSTVATSSPTTSVSAENSSATTVSAGLDPASVTWFDVLCTDMLVPLAAIDKADAALGPAGHTPQQMVVNGAGGLAAFTNTAESLATTPAPGFEGGAAYASAVITELQTLIPIMTAGQARNAADVAALDPNDAAAAEQLMSKWEREGFAVFEPLFTAIGRLDPAIVTAVDEIPSCKAAGGLFNVIPPPSTESGK